MDYEFIVFLVSYPPKTQVSLFLGITLEQYYSFSKLEFQNFIDDHMIYQVCLRGFALPLKFDYESP